MPPSVYVNRIATAVPENEVHRFFLRYAASMLQDNDGKRAVFNRMVNTIGIEARFSCFVPATNPKGRSVDFDGAFPRGGFPGVTKRMELFAVAAPMLAKRAVEELLASEDRSQLTHLIVTTCTGFSAPGIDLELVAMCGLPISIERTIIGFMGCYAAINALKLSRHIVRSDPKARVLIVNIELCTLHLNETEQLEKLVSFCLWGDGCAATLVSAEPMGLSLESFHAVVAREARELMSWNIHDEGFEMVLSGKVPAAIHGMLIEHGDTILGGRPTGAVDLWAVHPGGRSVLDSVERALQLPPAALAVSREVLLRNGNMSSATVMFVLAQMLQQGAAAELGCAMAFGPGLTAETMLFRMAA